jgi:hypothetical protein
MSEGRGVRIRLTHLAPLRSHKGSWTETSFKAYFLFVDHFIDTIIFLASKVLLFEHKTFLA